MLNENIRELRKASGLSQEELALKLNVVRQTVSKWEKGLSVPDAEMLIKIAEALNTTVNSLLGRAEPEPAENAESLKAIAAKLELLNEQFAKRIDRSRRIWRAVFIALGAVALAVIVREMLEFAFEGTVSSSIGIIGGADGPTSIIVTGSFRWWPLITSTAALIAAVIGLCHTRRR